MDVRANKAASWLPSPISDLTLRQFGLSRTEIADLAREFAASHEEQTEENFVRYAYKASAAQCQHAKARIGAPKIAIDWIPAKSSITNLLGIGYWPKVIEYARDEFIMLVREAVYKPISYEASFAHLLQQRWGLADPYRPEWTPGRASQRFLDYSGVGGGGLAEALTLFRQTPIGLAIRGMPHPDRLFCEFVLRWNGRPANLQQ